MKSFVKKNKTASRRGFTLVELLVVVSIMLILAGITLTTINVSMDAERIRAGSRQVQAFIEGARDRAIYAREPRGVRFIIDENLSDLGTSKYYCRSMLYIGPPTKLSLGFVEIFNDPNVPPGLDHRKGVILTNDVYNRWNRVYQRGLLADGARIRIFNTAETSWYTIRVIDDDSNNLYSDLINGKRGNIRTDQLELTRPFLGSSLKSQRYELELEPTVLPDQEPRLLPRGIVLDMSNSVVPAVWGNTQTSFANVKLDIMYAPNGIVTGSAASIGSIHLLLADVVDTAQDRGPGDPAKEGDERIISVNTKSGNTQTNAVHPLPDTLYYAETGK